MVTINGITGRMVLDNCPITGVKYYFQPFYKKLTRKDKRNANKR